MDRLIAACAVVAWLVPLVARGVPAIQSVGKHWLWVAAGFILHTLALATEGYTLGHLPLESMRFGLGALALWVMLGWAYLRRQPRMALLETLLGSLGVVLLVAGQLAPSGGPPDHLSTLWFPVHVVLILAGLLGFAVSFTLSLLFLVVRRRLKQRRLKGIARLPSLESLDR